MRNRKVWVLLLAFILTFTSVAPASQVVWGEEVTSEINELEDPTEGMEGSSSVTSDDPAPVSPGDSSPQAEVLPEQDGYTSSQDCGEQSEDVDPVVTPQEEVRTEGQNTLPKPAPQEAESAEAEKTSQAEETPPSQTDLADQEVKVQGEGFSTESVDSADKTDGGETVASDVETAQNQNATGQADATDQADAEDEASTRDEQASLEGTGADTTDQTEGANTKETGSEDQVTPEASTQESGEQAAGDDPDTETSSETATADSEDPESPVEEDTLEENHAEADPVLDEQTRDLAEQVECHEIAGEKLAQSSVAMMKLTRQMAPLKQTRSGPVTKTVSTFAELKQAILNADEDTQTIIEINTIDNILNFDESLTIAQRKDITLCAAGENPRNIALNASSTDTEKPAFFKVDKGASLTIGTTDSKYNLNLQLSSVSASVYKSLIENFGTLTINNGTLRDTHTGSDKDKKVEITEAAIVTSGENASFNMKGGSIESFNGTGVSIQQGAKMEMYDGQIYNNHHAGVEATNGATVTMSGGLVDYNWLGGVQLDKGATMTMTDGSVANNWDSGITLDHESSLNMKNGSITLNENKNFDIKRAGGVNILNGSVFEMTGGQISKNKGSTGGVMVGNHAAEIHEQYFEAGNLEEVQKIHKIAQFEMSGGIISENRGYWDAGGLYVSANANATMSGGAQITKNTTDVGGGGVLVQDGYLMKYAGDDLKGEVPQIDHEKWKNVFPGRFTMDGGSITNNVASGVYTYYDMVNSNSKLTELPVDGDGGGILIWSDNVHLKQGKITGNTARTHGGGIHVKTVPYHLDLENVLITENEAKQPEIYKVNAEGVGGGVWICPIGLVEIYSKAGSLLHGNTAQLGGADFYSMPKTQSSNYYKVNHANGVIFISSKTVNGEKIKWYKDPAAEGQENTPFDLSKEYKITYDLGLRAQIDSVQNTDFALIISGNTAGAGGGVATNGHLTIGQRPDPVSAELGGRKKLLSAEGEVVSLEGHDFEVERIIRPLEGAYPDLMRGYSLDDLRTQVKINEKGGFSLGDIKFLLPGPYIFEIREVLGDEKGIIYDPHIYRIEFMVVVDEEGNQLKLEQTTIRRYDPTNNSGNSHWEALDELLITNREAPETPKYEEPEPRTPVEKPPTGEITPCICKISIQSLPKTASVLDSQLGHQDLEKLAGPAQSSQVAFHKQATLALAAASVPSRAQALAA